VLSNYPSAARVVAQEVQFLKTQALLKNPLVEPQYTGPAGSQKPSCFDYYPFKTPSLLTSKKAGDTRELHQNVQWWR
jgi:hypothetical protein